MEGGWRQRGSRTLLTNNNCECSGTSTKHSNVAICDNISHQSYKYMNENKTSYCYNLSAPNNKNNKDAMQRKHIFDLQMLRESTLWNAPKQHIQACLSNNMQESIFIKKKKFNGCPRCSVLLFVCTCSHSLWRNPFLMRTSWIYPAFDNPSLNCLYCSCSNTL